MRPVRAKKVSPKRANMAVVKAAENMKGYPDVATGNAVFPGGSDHINFFIKYALPY